jgi:hypothetical protein
MQWKKQAPMVEGRVTNATPENLRQYTNLVGLYQLGMIGSGLKAFVIAELRLNMLWGLSGHTKWAEFCEDVLGVSRRGADNLVQDGVAVRRAMKLDEKLKKWLENDDVGKIFHFLGEPKFMKELPEATRAIVTDSRVARATWNIPAKDLEEVVSKSKENGKVTAKAVRATVIKMKPPQAPLPQPKAKVDKKRRKTGQRVMHNLRMAYKGLSDVGLLEPFKSRLAELAKEIEAAFLDTAP